MVTIIAGKLNEGKTSMMLDLYNKDHLGDGFACKKVIVNNVVTSYYFYRLSDGHEIPFMADQNYINDKTYYNQAFKRYAYSSKAIDEVHSYINQLIKNKVQPIYLDEIGRLEIQGGGHDATLKDLLNSHLDIIITVRDNFVEQVIENYKIKDYRIVGVKIE